MSPPVREPHATGVPDRGTLLVSVESLRRELDADSPPALLDVRWALTGPPGRERYEAAHIPSAEFVDLDRELAGPPGDGGRHPLPDASMFAAAMRDHGVDRLGNVVVMDDGDGTAAARAWWLLRFHGMPPGRVRLLDGGLQAWAASGGALESGHAAPRRQGDFVPGAAAMPLLDAASAAELAATGGLLLDARSAARFRGEVEPVDAIAGHIPGARSAPTTENVGPDATFLAGAVLRRRFTALGAAKAGAIGAYCGSGVTAAHTVLALSLAGFPASLYAGSWSDWIRDPRRPVATGPG